MKKSQPFFLTIELTKLSLSYLYVCVQYDSKKQRGMCEWSRVGRNGILYANIKISKYQKIFYEQIEFDIYWT